LKELERRSTVARNRIEDLEDFRKRLEGAGVDLLREMVKIFAEQLMGADADAACGAVPGAQERLTMTVEEAASALGIRRAFAYEAVTRNEIPHVRIGRRILIPRVALNRLLDQADGERCGSLRLLAEDRPRGSAGPFCGLDCLDLRTGAEI